MTAWESTRPGIVEGIAIEKVIYLAKKIGCSLCIAHVSSKEGVEAIRKEKGRVLLETTPHYLTLTKEAGLGALGKVSPPIRSKSDQDSLWEYIDEGFPVVIGSDHNPWQKQHKLDMWEGSAGLPGKGTLNIGADADLVIVDEDFGQKVDPAKIPSIVDYSPYFDYVFPAWPAVVLRSGIRCNINDSE
jgi:dihydropyrimidinase